MDSSSSARRIAAIWYAFVDWNRSNQFRARREAKQEAPDRPDHDFHSKMGAG
jgi:hypothetical protein